MQQMCRTCLTKNNVNMRCLFKENLTMKIKAISEIEIRKEDGLTTFVCEECFLRINQSYELRKKIIESDYTLKLDGHKQIIITMDQMICEPNAKPILELEDEVTETNEINNFDSGLSDENDFSENSRVKNNKFYLEKGITSLRNDVLKSKNDILISLEYNSSNNSANNRSQFKNYNLTPKKVYLDESLSTKQDSRLNLKIDNLLSKEKDLNLDSSINQESPLIIKNLIIYCRKDNSSKTIKNESNSKKHNLVIKNNSSNCQIHGLPSINNSLPCEKETLKINVDQEFFDTSADPASDDFVKEANDADSNHSENGGFSDKNDNSSKNSSVKNESLSPKKRIRKKKYKIVVTPSMCPICGKSIRSDNLKRHLEVHAENQQITCNICGRVFKNYGSYRSHPMMHEKEHNICEICGKQFEYKGEYIRHKHLHRPKKNHCVCNICGKTLKGRGLKKHMQSHTGERPYPCKYCRKYFSSRTALKIHTRQHTHDTPYICHICSTKFNQRVSLRTHYQNKHFFCPEEIKTFFDKIDGEKKKKT